MSEKILTLVDKCKLNITNVDEVLAFDEKEIQLNSENGKIYIRGSELKITNFDGEKKILSASGVIDGVFYKDNAKILKKIFK